MQCLYLIKQDKWESAHDIAQNINTKIGMLLHGYLHKLEGDLWNSKYWYQKSGFENIPQNEEEEWEYILKKCLARN